MVDGDHNSMGYLYEAMDKAKEAIQHLYGSNKTKYEPIWRIIDRRWNHQLHQHIHAAAYFLNPKFFYSPSFKADAEVRIGLDTCIRRLVDDEILRDLILDELQSYKKALGELFSSPDCKRRRATLRPGKKKHMFNFYHLFLSLRLLKSLQVINHILYPCRFVVGRLWCHNA